MVQFITVIIIIYIKPFYVNAGRNLSCPATPPSRYSRRTSRTAPAELMVDCVVRASLTNSVSNWTHAADDIRIVRNYDIWLRLGRHFVVSSRPSLRVRLMRSVSERISSSQRSAVRWRALRQSFCNWLSADGNRPETGNYGPGNGVFRIFKR